MEKSKPHLFTKKKQLELTNAELSQQMYKRNLELAETNQALSLLRNIDSLVLESHDELAVLCQGITRQIIDHSNYPFVILLARPPRGNYLEVLGVASLFDKRDIKPYRLEMEHFKHWLMGPDRSTRVDVKSLSDAQLAHLLHETRDMVRELRYSMPVQSALVVKMISRSRIVGLMVIGFTHPEAAITEKDIQFIHRLSDAVGVALDNRLLFEENLLVQKQLQKTNAKLKALDETKDEFISMASHQLRTPLTSVKGYLSMVLEGDAGKVDKNQEKLLDQAFASSQRMVYLIADLLNVSRLRTGKFVIERVPCNLAEVVEGEVNQLKETAQARKLTLTYKKPKAFPTLMLDETKIRQVIMNFMDNAIYYTPAGGHIEVKLTKTPKTVEYTVTDNGIGVAKAEQHHLFSKFYRAGNAKKARPDGTGLGLFMAKKVIVAQGGSLIFKSEEGQGSTFGFSFATSKIKAPKTKPSPKA